MNYRFKLFKPAVSEENKEIYAYYNRIKIWNHNQVKDPKDSLPRGENSLGKVPDGLLEFYNGSE